MAHIIWPGEQGVQRGVGSLAGNGEPSYDATGERCSSRGERNEIKANERAREPLRLGGLTRLCRGGSPTAQLPDDMRPCRR